LLREKLDAALAEALGEASAGEGEGAEEQQKRSLCLANYSLGDTGTAYVVERIRGSRSVAALSVPNNAIGDAGAAALADLLRGKDGMTLERVQLDQNNIGRDGIEVLADALKQNTTLRELQITDNPGVDPTAAAADASGGGSDAEAAAGGVAALVAAIGVNTALELVAVGLSTSNHQRALFTALEDTEARRSGRERFLTGSLTKAANKKD
jgi:Leucine Rich repeat